MKCLEKDRTRRYETANGLALDIGRHLNNEPVTARPASQWYRLQKAWRRNTLAFSAVLAVLAILVIALVAIARAAQREKRAHRQETVQRTRAEQNEKIARESEARESQLRQQAETATLDARRNLYAADMLLVQQASTDGDLGEMRRLLDRYQPASGAAEDLRGWEWYHYWNETRSSELFTLGGGAFQARSLCFVGANRLAALFEDGTLQLHDVPSRQLLSTFKVPLESELSSLAVFASADEQFLVESSNENLFLLEAESLRVRKKMAFDIPFRILAVDGNSTVIGQLESSIQELSLPGLTLLRSNSLPPGFTAAISSDRKLVYLWRESMQTEVGEFQIRLLESGQLLASGTNLLPARGARFSPNSRWISESGHHPRKSAAVREVSTGREAARFEDFRGWVTCSAWAPDSTLLAFGSADRTIHLVSAGSWETAAILKGHLNEVSVLAFSPDGSLIFSGDKDGQIKVWSARNLPSTAAQQALGGVRFSPGGTRGIQQNGESTAVYQLPEARLLANVPYRILAIGPDDKLWASATETTLSVRDGPQGRTLAETTLPANLLAAGFASSNLLAFIDAENLWLWRFRSTNALESRRLLLPMSRRDPRLCLSSQGDRAAVCGPFTVGLYSLNGQLPPLFLQGHKQGVRGAAFSSDGKILATASYDASVKLWDTATGTLHQSLRSQAFAFESVAFSRDGSRLAAGGVDGTVRLWETQRWLPVGLLTGADAFVHDLAFGPSDAYLVTGSRALLKVYEAPVTMTPIQPSTK